ncbi:glycoside hydrolase family 3 C-terminal domain-containing protein [Akkermansiaceae bacterium]|nr:glycoside hydrolase family 3 C-terminal domain-containing protein [Akkermansiaceae bacterium]MDB4435989.1 glycoside hydrolase family 3 C-terminal domain-containing protein [Akkermansiaceae bacterium]
MQLTAAAIFLSFSGIPVLAQNSEEWVREFLPSLSLEQKVGQMTQITITALEGEPGKLDPAKLANAITKYEIGSILNVPNPGAPTPARWAEVLTQIEKETQNSEKKIPILYGVDSIHGASYTKGATLFPQQIGLAATWNTTLVEAGAQVSAYETRASSIPWVFSPDLDLPRNLLWPRTWETFGQDTFLSSRMGEAMVRGFEGDDISSKTNVAACIKHFVGYGSPTTGRDRTPSLIPDRMLKQYDLPIFQAAIDSGARSIMINSGEVNGTPVHASKKLLTDILQTEMGFKGVILTDWEDIMYLKNRHKVAATMKDAVRIAVNAGIDMSMVPNDFHFHDHLVALVNEGAVPMSRIDHAVTKILTLKYELGLFDRPLAADAKDYPDFANEKATSLAYQAAAESITLLKNDDNTLPLKKGGKVLVTGPTANSLNSLNGGWTYTWQGDADKWAPEKYTVLEAFEAKLGKENVVHVPGTTFDKAIDIAAAVKASKDCETIILCLGESNYTETPGDIDDLRLEWPQQNLATQLAATGKPIVLVLLQGRPRVINLIVPKVHAIFQAYLPGNEGAPALVDLIYGKANPSGCLPYNYPHASGGLQPYNRKHTQSLPDDEPNYTPQFEFGHGLSYTTFKTSALKVDRASFKAGDSVKITATVTNSGNRAGKKVVQLYLSDHFSSITPQVKALKGFQKIDLVAGESKEVTFELKPRAFQFVDADEKWIAEAGKFTIAIDDQNVEIELVE